MIDELNMTFATLGKQLVHNRKLKEDEDKLVLTVESVVE